MQFNMCLYILGVAQKWWERVLFMWELLFHMTMYEYLGIMCVDLYCSCTYGFSCCNSVCCIRSGLCMLGGC